MKSKATFYHAGCPVCIDAEQGLVLSLDKNRFNLEIVHLGEDEARINEAENAGVKSVPALILDDTVFHITTGLQSAI